MKLLDRVPSQQPASGSCKIAFITDFPRVEERLNGFPLLGADGRIFDQLLRLSSLANPGASGAEFPSRIRSIVAPRAEFLITQVFNEQPAGDVIKSFCAAAPERKGWGDGEHYNLAYISGAGYLSPEYREHLNRLRDELEHFAPNLIVTLGSVALWAVSGLCDASLARGCVFSCSLLAPGVKLLPTLHPETVRKDFRQFHVVRGDLIRAAREAEFPEVRPVQRRIHIRPTVADLRTWRDRLLQAEMLAVDIETAKQQITCIGFAPSPAEAFVIPFVDYEQPSRSYWSSAEGEVAAWSVVREICEAPGPKKVMQNGLYDCYYLIRQAAIYPQNYSEDCRLQHHALYPELPKSLSFMGSSYESPPGPWKTMREKKEVKRDD